MKRQDHLSSTTTHIRRLRTSMTHNLSVRASDFPVAKVTVFRADSAEVTRYLPLELKQGTNEVEITQLPSSLEEDSIRVDGIGNAIISDVIYHPPTSARSNEQHTEALKQLGTKKKILQDERDLLEKQEQMLKQYSDSVSVKDTDASCLQTFLEVYQKRKAAINIALRETGDKIQQVDDEITEENKRHNKDEESKIRATRITVIVAANVDGPAELSVIYLVRNASWKPLYDLRAIITEKKTEITIHYRANITQRTGENWSDVELTLSTASPQLGSTIPVLQPEYVGEVVSVIHRSKAKGGFGFSSTKKARAIPRSAELSKSRRDREIWFASEDDYMMEKQARVESGVLTTSFAIDGKSTIPSNAQGDHTSHQVAITVLDFSADLEWIAIPREQQSAFLQAKIRNKSEYLLLPGQANIFLDDNFVAKSPIPYVSTNETFRISLGQDPMVRVTYHPAAKMHQSQGGFLTTHMKTTTTKQRTTIKNTRGAHLTKLIVRDQVPVPSHQDIKVTLREPSTLMAPEVVSLMSTGKEKEKVKEWNKEYEVSKGIKARWYLQAEEEDENDTPSDPHYQGIIEWKGIVKAGTTVELALAWDVTAPAGLTWGNL